MPTFTDLTGQRFGRLLVLYRDDRTAGPLGGALWRCRCDCGSECSPSSNRLHAGQRSCAHCSRSRRLVDLSGKRFGLLTVVERAPSASGQTMWLCRCDCGSVFSANAQRLRGGQRACQRCKNITHGQSVSGRRAGTREYAVWQAMIQRCENPNNPQFGDYGGRGIVVCARWRHSFQDFLADVGPRPTAGHSIDRINNNGGYEAGNVRWATRLEQRANQRPIGQGVKARRHQG